MQGAEVQVKCEMQGPDDAKSLGFQVNGDVEGPGSSGFQVKGEKSLGVQGEESQGGPHLLH